MPQILNLDSILTRIWKKNNKTNKQKNKISQGDIVFKNALNSPFKLCLSTLKRLYSTFPREKKCISTFKSTWMKKTKLLVFPKDA